MNATDTRNILIAIVCIALAACVPLVANGYWLSVALTAMMYIALSTSWALFSGPTHYISLASGAFFGIGGYLVATGMSDYNLSFWLMMAVSAVVATIFAGLIGMATLRLSGVYFVIFTLGLAEMIRNMVSWLQNNVLGSRGLYVLTDFTEAHIYWMLLFGIIGYFMKMYGFQVGPVILGVILGPMMDSNYRRAMLGARGDVGTFFWNFVSHPISLVLSIALLAMLLSQTPLVRWFYRWRSSSLQ